MKKAAWKVLSVLAVTAALVSGCMNNQAQPRTLRGPGSQPGPMQSPAPVPPASQPPAPPAQGMNEESPMREARNIADALVGKHNIERANVFVAGRTAYVAVNIPNMAQGAITDQIKTDVANTVRGVEPDIQQVYVSADPDLYNRFQGYSNDIQQGRPIQGIFQRFMETVKRVFPEAR
ncbi:YhcN/YlaJ family sporulation lipoprotein [Effusibacillus lacus]|uniref:YhcN/YlaJ family sporulation lipoprotein n=1 Tax=Effusibacillus lacus TaxID=1348429 RepID=UPI000BB929F9|nr:YhcN/YlaJ family sporulation lipoprotein [Effusibacillus lacus]